MLQLDIQALPNQQFTSDIDGHRVAITLRVAINVMVADVSLDDVVLIRGVRVVTGQPILPYPYISNWGNLVLTTQNDELPWWENFGQDQFLYYLTPAELLEATA